ncbi:MAG: hypothetical protein H0T59_06720 [Chloroflexi bacterium]|nr:hypothetical protein [Chloroflexota bacterium]
MTDVGGHDGGRALTGGGGADRLPTGTVTFLRTDVEGSMRLVRELGSAWDDVNATHLGIIRSAVESHGGFVVRTEGDAVFAAFPEARAATEAAVAAQRALHEHHWPMDGGLAVRMGLHSGEAHLAGDDYGGFDVNRAARVAAAGHGGQIVLSGTTAALVALSLPTHLTVRDLGLYVLKDMPAPERLFQLDVDGQRTTFPPVRASPATTGNLPDRLTTFIGRAADLAALDGLVDAHRLITLTGPGGIGKTSLAIELARGRADTVPDGAWFVALDSVTDPGLVGAVIARTIGLFDGAERPAADALPRFIAERSLLLVIDNFEHLMAASAEVATLVRASPKSRFIVTSRAPLRLGGEQDYPVRPLSVGNRSEPAGDASLDAAARLFIDRARAVRPGWEPAGDLGTVSRICALLDGLPLGIELAAARISVLPVRAIHDRLEARLPLPGSGPRDAPARQRTLEATIAWSHDLLSDDEKSALHALSVFEAGFDADQAAVVVGWPEGDLALDLLVSLSDQSLIARDQGGRNDRPLAVASGIRFAMTKTVQDVSLRWLVEGGTDAEVRHRHASAMLALAEVATAHLFASGQDIWLDRLAMDHPNLRAALRWAIDAGDVDVGLRFVAALWRFWQMDGHLAEGRAWADEVLAMPGADAPTLTRVHALGAAGGIAYWRGDVTAARDLYRAQLALAETIGDRATIADGWFNLASVIARDDSLESHHCLMEARRAFEEIGDARGVNRCDWALANLAMIFDGPAVAFDSMSLVRDRAVELGDAPYAALAGGSMAWDAHAMGDLPSALRWSLSAIEGMYALRDVASTTISLPIGATLALLIGRPEDAAVILGAFNGLSDRYGVTPPYALSQLIMGVEPMDQVREQLAPEVLDGALDRGQRMTLDEVMPLVMSLGQ